MSPNEVDRMVTVYVAALPSPDPEIAEQMLWPVIDFLPFDQGQKILAKRRPIDRALQLLTRALLAVGLNQEAAGLAPGPALAQFRVDANGRPSCRVAVFSLSHSSPYGVCAMTKPGWTTGLGVDVESVQNLDPDDFTSVFTAEELEAIKSAENQGGELIRRWTVKEAGLKALGLGFSADPRPICSDLKSEGLTTDNLIWHHLKLKPGFWVTVAAVVTENFESRLQQLETNDYLKLFTQGDLN